MPSEAGSTISRAATITVTVRFVGPFRALAGRDQSPLSLREGAPLSAALRVLRDRVPGDFAAQVLDPVLTKQIEPTMILHNRQPVAMDLSLRLDDGDMVAFVPPMAGG